MMHNAQAQALSPSALTTPAKRVLNSVGLDSPSTNGLRFEEVLARSKPGSAINESGNARADQMWEAKPANGRERRKQERLEQYRDGIDQQSASQVEERAGVETRQALIAASRQPAMEAQPLSPRNLEKSGAEEASSPSESNSSTRVKEPPLESKPADSRQAKTTTATRTTSDQGTSGHSNAQPRSSSASPTPVRESDPVVGTGARVSSDGPQLAKEIARALTTNGANSVREIPTVAAGSGSHRAGNTSSPEIAKSESKELTRTSQEPTAGPKSADAAKVSEFEKLVRLVRASSGKQSTARVMLDPPQLGRVHVRVVVEGDRVEIGVETENDAARQIISQRAAKLKSVLEENGFLMDRFDVAVNQSGLFDAQGATAATKPTVQEQVNRKSQRDGNGRPPNMASANKLGNEILIQSATGLSRNFDFEV